MVRPSPLRLAALLSALALPAAADHLDPRLAGPLQAMFQAAVQECQSGNGASCNAAQAIQRREAQLSQAEHACRQGSAQACRAYQEGAQQVFGAYQQQQRAGMLGGVAYPQGAPVQGGGQGYSTQQMNQDHQARMRQQQNQFQQHQDRMRQQQNQFDQQNQRFLEQLRR
ncbi:hypothetical protein ACLF3G_00435 [Falsiroseomonas sp. HC035]|uniref:hypothetical protein n=1 Tax=Falsiroseomonas sp. HC035 TaxID=3390999 RepID=UPI003D31410A